MKLILKNKRVSNQQDTVITITLREGDITEAYRIPAYMVVKVTGYDIGYDRASNLYYHYMWNGRGDLYSLVQVGPYSDMTFKLGKSAKINSWAPGQYTIQFIPNGTLANLK